MKNLLMFILAAIVLVAIFLLPERGRPGRSTSITTCAHSSDTSASLAPTLCLTRTASDADQTPEIQTGKDFAPGARHLCRFAADCEIHANNDYDRLDQSDPPPLVALTSAPRDIDSMFGPAKSAKQRPKRSDLACKLRTNRLPPDAIRVT